MKNTFHKKVYSAYVLLTARLLMLKARRKSELQKLRGIIRRRIKRNLNYLKKLKHRLTDILEKETRKIRVSVVGKYQKVTPSEVVVGMRGIISPWADILKCVLKRITAINNSKYVIRLKVAITDIINRDLLKKLGKKDSMNLKEKPSDPHQSGQEKN